MIQTSRQFARGFLPEQDPLPALPPAHAAWEALGQALPKLALTDYLRREVESLPPLNTAVLQTESERWRAATLLAYVTTHYLLGALDSEPLDRIPANVAVPLVEISTSLGIPPILSYALQAMFNWRRLDETRPVEVGNLTLINNFLGGQDEEWFVTLHINIEAVAGEALQVLQGMQTAVSNGDSNTLKAHLHTVANTLQKMHDLLLRMPEKCEPHIYYHRVRPFMFGWKDNPALPNGVIYEGVAAFGEKPMQFRGETGAQSGVIPAIDAALGVSHERDEMRIFLNELRDYMPPADRAFVTELENGPDVRAFVQASSDGALRDAYNEALHKLQQFRRLHIEYAAAYILKPANVKAAVGTGGTPFTFYLKKHIKETEQHLL